MSERGATARTAYGGQAVIEGVMIRGRERVATAVRRKNGEIVMRRGVADAMLMRHKWLRFAFLRGLPALIDSVRLGMNTLTWSADVAMEGEEQAKPTPVMYVLTIAFALVIGIGLFVILPNLTISFAFGHPWRPASGASFWAQFTPSPAAILPNLLEGLMRLAILVVYILVIARNPEIRRVFSYHGAEHKVVNAYEAGGLEALTVEGARAHSRIHPRCGTSFIVLIIVVGIVVHAFIGWPENKLLLLASRLVLLVPIVSIAYELIRLAGRFRSTALLTAVVWPGLLLQQLTTAEPADDQIEVALASMRAVLEDEGVLQPAPVAEVSGEPAV